jgi:hypothetical protein
MSKLLYRHLIMKHFPDIQGRKQILALTPNTSYSNCQSVKLLPLRNLTSEVYTHTETAALTIRASLFTEKIGN